MSKKISRIFSCLIGFVILVALDQWTKGLAVTHLKEQNPFVIWDGVFEFVYSENRGAAFGLFQERQTIFAIVAAVVFLAVIYVVYKLPHEKKFMPFLTCAVCIAAGAAGNMIDRVSNQYVVDFLYFRLIDFPIFNVADCYVTVSTAVFFVLLCFGFYSEEDLDCLRPGKGKETDRDTEVSGR